MHCSTEDVHLWDYFFPEKKRKVNGIQLSCKIKQVKLPTDGILSLILSSLTNHSLVIKSAAQHTYELSYK